MTREESPIHLLAIMLGGMVGSISAPLFFAAQIVRDFPAFHCLSERGARGPCLWEKIARKSIKLGKSD